jgi:hypothetical protein
MINNLENNTENIVSNLAIVEQNNHPKLRVLKSQTILNTISFYQDLVNKTKKDGFVLGVEQHKLFIKHSVSYSTLKALKQLKLITTIRPGVFEFANSNLSIVNAMKAIRLRNVIQEKNRIARYKKLAKLKEDIEKQSKKEKIKNVGNLTNKELAYNLTKKNPRVKLLEPTKVEPRKYNKKKKPFFRRLLNLFLGK